MKKISILGSSGSIGRSGFEVAMHLGYEVVALAAHSQVDRIEEQARACSPQCVCLFDEKSAAELKRRLPHLEVVSGVEGLIHVATLPSVDFVLSAIVGAAGVVPTLRAVEAGKRIGLANKEALVVAGELVTRAAERSGARLLPVDSEHSALFQCLQGEQPQHISRLILTASGGPFRTWTREQLGRASPEDALAHPNWSMGKKITIDSSTLMNKGLEVIEAHFLFNIPFNNIEVVIHPQSIIHSFIECIDGSLLAQMGEPDMKLPIQYALTYPERKRGIAPCFDFQKYSKMELFKPDHATFPLLNLACEAGRIGGTLPCFMNGANEVLVGRFLNGEIGYLEIEEKLERLMSRHTPLPQESLETLLEVDREARILATRE